MSIIFLNNRNSNQEMVEKDGVALNYEIGEQITRFDLKGRNFEKKLDFFVQQKKIYGTVLEKIQIFVC